MLSFFCNIIMVVLHVMSDGVVFTSNRLDPSTIWMLFLPITELSKIRPFLTSFTRHGCLRFWRKKDRLRPHAGRCQKYRISASRTFLSQTVCGWLIVWCMTRIFLHFKAYSAYLYDHSPEGAPEWPKKFCPHMLGVNAKWTCHTGCYVTERVTIFSSVEASTASKRVKKSKWIPDCRHLWDWVREREDLSCVKQFPLLYLDWCSFNWQWSLESYQKHT